MTLIFALFALLGLGVTHRIRQGSSSNDYSEAFRTFANYLANAEATLVELLLVKPIVDVNRSVDLIWTYWDFKVGVGFASCLSLNFSRMRRGTE